MKAVFIRALDVDDKASCVLDAVHARHGSLSGTRFRVDPDRFSAVPGSPFAYWVGSRVLALFKELPSFAESGGTAKQGLATADDFRFVRGWWETPANARGVQWFPVAKGGRYSPFYADIHLVVNWGRDGAEIVNFTKPGSDRVASRPQNVDRYFQPGLTWPLRTRRFCPQVLPAGVVISVRGSGIYSDDPLAVLAIFGSVLPDHLMKLQSGQDGRPQFDMGDVAQLPVPAIPREQVVALRKPARRGWSLMRSLDRCVEVSHAFVLPALLLVGGRSLAVRAAEWAHRGDEVERELTGVQAEIDQRCFELYGIGGEDRRAIVDGFGAAVADAGGADAGSEDLEEEGHGAGVDLPELVAELVSWAVGVAVGRFDVRLATGDRALPADPEPFDPLPVCAPGMLVEANGLPVEQAPAGYPVVFPKDGVLVDDPGHERNLGDAVQTVFEAVFGAGADAVLEEVAGILAPKDQDLRSWLRSDLFAHHLKLHSKSRRKAPILWQLATASGGFSVWLYAHRVGADTLFQVQNDFVAPKLAHEERQLTHLIQESGRSPSSRQGKAIAAKEAFVAELRAMLDDIKQVAPSWDPDFDDGIVLAMAPLWRLVPQHKAWQRELWSHWGDLENGKYDWAHIAMRLWPERVITKCATDRSLAIAHRLEDEFWDQDADGKYQPRETPTTPINQLIQQRSRTA